ncbi:coagulation factor VII-like [Eucyclogobius newberryi]|uniref:coagulation factor VII-like n=1 Tax=Eucyclogobius newberryi TaxID=166745 RepID=UPI003B5B6B67
MDLVLLVLLGLSSAWSAAVFLDVDQAHRVLKSGPVLVWSTRGSGPGSSTDPDPGPTLVRTRRYNSGWLEELQRGDLRRECVEEICSYEEAREVFEHTETTNEFWKTYQVQDRCSSGPCLNGGTCVDLGLDFTCLCPPNFSGLTCQLDDHAARRRCLVENGGCAHFCEEQEAGPKCSCAHGYHLDQDQISCSNSEPIACGMVPVLRGRSIPPQDPRARIVGGSECPRGECPWTVLLRYKNRVFCGGVFLGPDWVLTAAHCLEDIEQHHLEAVVGEHDVDLSEGSEQRVRVSAIHVHTSYNPRTADNDIALLRMATPIAVTAHAVPVCLPTSAHAHTQLHSKRMHMVSGWGRVHEAGPTSRVLKRLQVPLVRNQTCQDQTGLVLTQNMLCAGFLGGQQDSCKGDSGGPLVTRFRQTWFLTGIVSWGRGCARPGQYGIYTRVANYLDWIRTRTGLGPGGGEEQNKNSELGQDQTTAKPNKVLNQTTTEPDQDPGLDHNQTTAGQIQNQARNQTWSEVDLFNNETITSNQNNSQIPDQQHAQNETKQNG